MKSKLITLLLALGAGVMGTAHAQSTWTYSSFTENTTNAGTFGNSYSYTQGGVKLTVSAFSTTAGTNGGTAAGQYAAANIANWGVGSGFGVRNTIEGINASDPQHSMDNYASVDLLALNFTNATTNAQVAASITNIATGWHNTATNKTCGTGTCGTDSDISLLRWNGTGGPTITGGTISSLLAAGWVLVNNFENMVDDANRTVTGNTGSSSWWIISAYNSAWSTGAAASVNKTTGLSDGDDFMKVLSSITAAPSKVPEPGSLALAAIALLGLGAARRARRS